MAAFFMAMKKLFFQKTLDKKRFLYYTTFCGGVAQLVRAFGSHPRGLGFESLRLHQKKASTLSVLFSTKSTLTGG